MPPRGVRKGSKRDRQYEHVKESELELGRSIDRAEEIAARTVNKEKARRGETKSSRGKAPRRDAANSARRRGRDDGRTRVQLYEEARALDIPGRSRMTKAELQRAVGARR